MSIEDIRARILGSSIAHYVDAIVPLLRPTILLRTAPEQESVPVGACKLGGAPDLPPEFEWSHRNETPLAFVAQIDLSVVKPYDLQNLLPPAGMLYFFCDAVELVWGDPEDRDGWRVYYYDGSREWLLPAALPDTMPDDARFREVAVYPELIYTLPDHEELEFIAPELYRQMTDDESDAYHELRLKLIPTSSYHWMLGHHTPIQYPANAQAIEAMYGIPYEQASARAQELVLLLQLDSDDDADMMWGDVGTLYFWIHQDDLAARRFDRVWLIMQCC
ncbi:MAG: YwqG family protein [Fimbriimonadales bacterium]|nr:YwqG family protein [Fimbriimonadales bacterium]